MPKIIQTTVYTFRELKELAEKGKASSTALERARQYLRDAITEGTWYDYPYDLWTQALEQVGFPDAEISFSGFWCQGDGASFTCKRVNVPKLVEFFARPIEPQNRIEPDESGKENFLPYVVHKLGGKPTTDEFRRLAMIADYLTCEVVRTNTYYSHENTCHLRVEMYLGNRDYPKLGRLLDEFEKTGEELRYKLSRVIYGELDAEYEGLTENESLEDFAEVNDCTFTLAGERFG